MPKVYIHYFGTESSTSLLKAYGIEKDDNNLNQLVINLPKSCPNCGESNKKDSKFCANMKCRMVLTFSAYSETVEEQKKKDEEIKD